MSCDPLENPTNGEVDLSGSTYQSTADYSCIVGYQLSGVALVTCEASGEWSDPPPQCDSESSLKFLVEISDVQ